MNGSPAELLEKRMSVPDLFGIPPEMRGLLRTMLEPDPAKRLASMSAVRDWVEDIPDVYGSGDGTVIMPSSHELVQKPLDLIATAASPKPPPKLRPVIVPEDSAPPPAASAIPSILAACAVVAAVASGSVAGWYYVKSSGTSRGTGDVKDAVEALTPAIFAADFDGGPCFFAAMGRAPNGRQFVLAYGNNAQTAEKFGSSYKTSFKESADLNFNSLSDGQCPYVPLLRQVHLANAERPWLKLLTVNLRQAKIARGADIIGSIEGLRQSSRYLLIVNGEGAATNASSNLQSNDSGIEFSLRTNDSANDHGHSSLIVVLSASAPLDVLERRQSKLSAEDYDELLKELSSSELEAAVDMKKVTIE